MSCAVSELVRSISPVTIRTISLTHGTRQISESHLGFNTHSVVDLLSANEDAVNFRGASSCSCTSCYWLWHQMNYDVNTNKCLQTSAESLRHLNSNYLYKNNLGHVLLMKCNQNISTDDLFISTNRIRVSVDVFLFFFLCFFCAPRGGGLSTRGQADTKYRRAALQRWNVKIERLRSLTYFNRRSFNLGGHCRYSYM